VILLVGNDAKIWIDFPVPLPSLVGVQIDAPKAMLLNVTAPLTGLAGAQPVGHYGSSHARGWLS